MGRSTTSKDAEALFHSLRSAYAATPTNLKIIDVYVIFSVSTALLQVAYMVIVGSFPFNSFLSGVLSCVGTTVLAERIYTYILFPFHGFFSGVLSCIWTIVFAVCLRIQVNKENKEFKDLPPERAFADFVLCNLVLHLVIMNFIG